MRDLGKCPQGFVNVDRIDYITCLLFCPVVVDVGGWLGWREVRSDQRGCGVPQEEG